MSCFYGQQPLFVEQEHRIYSFLSQMEVLGHISLKGVKPYKFSSIQAILKNLEREDLSVKYQLILKSFKNEFQIKNDQSNEFQPVWTVNGFKHSFNSVYSSGFEKNNEKLVFYNEGKDFVSAGIRLQAEFIRSSRLISTEYNGFGRFGNFHFSLLKQDYAVSDSKNQLVGTSRFLINKWSNGALRDGSVKSADHSRGYLAYSNKNITAWLGRIPFEIGSGESGKFVLNGFQTSIPTSLGFSFDFWKIRYHGMHASLTAPELMVTLEENNNGHLNFFRKSSDKFLVSHRFELDLHDNFQIHYNEMIVYGNRSIDLNYLNPFSFLRPLEHELGDRDNAIITLGGKLKLPNLNLMGYADFILDEWKLEELDSYWSDKKSWWANKHGVLTGLTWANHGFQLWGEYVAIAPWVYTHKFDANRYTHDGSTLGYNLGPNSRTLYYKAAYQFNPQLRIEISHRRESKGENFNETKTGIWNVGGDIFKGHTTRFGGLTSTRTFLEGNLKKRNTSRFKIRYDHNHYIKMEAEYKSISNLDNVLLFYFSLSY